MNADGVARYPRYVELKSIDLSSNVGDDIGSRVEKVKSDEDVSFRGTNKLTFRCSDSNPMTSLIHEAFMCHKIISLCLHHR